MGYESRLYLVLPGTWAQDIYVYDEDGAWTEEKTGRQALSAQKVAMVDLSKAGYDTATAEVIAAAIVAEKERLLKGTEENPVHGHGIYISGDEFADQDKYADPLAPVDLDALITALEADVAADDYRRFVLMLATAKIWRDLLDRFPGAFVLHYGY